MKSNETEVIDLLLRRKLKRLKPDELICLELTNRMSVSGEVILNINNNIALRLDKDDIHYDPNLPDAIQVEYKNIKEISHYFKNSIDF